MSINRHFHDDPLNQGHGAIHSLNRYDDFINVAFVLGMRGELDRAAGECRDAVRVALRDGAAGLGGRGEPCFAREIDRLLEAADRAAEELDERRRQRLIDGCAISRSRETSPAAPAARVEIRGTRGRPGARAA